MLIYIGAGKFLPGVPARDLTEAEVSLFGGKEALLKSGLYRLPRKSDILGGQENKVVGPQEVKHD